MPSVRETVAALSDNLSALTEKDQDFARSLMASALSRRGLSSKQAYWLGVLADRAVNPKPKPEAVSVGDVSGIVALFDKAAARIKSPAFLIHAPGIDEPLRLSIATERAKVPGSINVATPGRDNKWFGRITRAGEFQPSARFNTPEIMGPLVLALRAMADDPAGTADAYGKLHGRCCFCNDRISAGKSTARGYGPTCAKNYGLPY